MAEAVPGNGDVVLYADRTKCGLLSNLQCDVIRCDEMQRTLQFAYLCKEQRSPH